MQSNNNEKIIVLMECKIKDYILFKMFKIHALDFFMTNSLLTHNILLLNVILLKICI